MAQRDFFCVCLRSIYTVQLEREHGMCSSSFFIFVNLMCIQYLGDKHPKYFLKEVDRCPTNASFVTFGLQQLDDLVYPKIYRIELHQQYLLTKKLLPPKLSGINHLIKQPSFYYTLQIKSFVLHQKVVQNLIMECSFLIF